MSKYEGEEGKRRLAEAVAEQKFVQGNRELAALIAEQSAVRSVAAGEAIIQQDAEDHQIFLILSGSFLVRANGRDIATRFPGNTVGEMAAIQPTQRRSADVIAREPSDVAVLEETQLAALGKQFPDVWRFFAKELARRLLERNRLLSAPHPQIRVFIISSAESIEVARAVQNAFEHDPFFCQPWSEGVFRVAKYPIENLERELDQSDFAIAVCSPDDLTTSRGAEQPSPRDNVIFELGFFMGRLGRHRTFLLEPQGGDLKLPSDVKGLQTVFYRYAPKPDLAAAIAPACNKLRDAIKELGPYV